MSLAVIYSRGQVGMHAPLVTVETHLSNGLPSFSIVGLPETAVKESKERVRSALLNSHFEFPLKRITINLAPAELPKQGGRFDLPIALGILCASNQLPQQALESYEFAGELALNGTLRPIHSALPFALSSQKAKRTLILPIQNAPEASLPGNNTILACSHILDICAHLKQEHPIPSYHSPAMTQPSHAEQLDMQDVRGQTQARRALEITAAGGHNLIMVGPPGTGKTMLASRLPGILPALTNTQALEVATLASLSQQGFNPQSWRQVVFRSPHHTASGVALVGGGSNPKPGEISLSHHGVLFLDELPEFDRKVLEVLREPLESGKITISRATRQVEFPAQFLMVAAMNPCPCGYLGDPRHECRCSPQQVQRYLGRISGPLLDRIDVHIKVPPLTAEMLISTPEQTPESSKVIKQRVTQARERQIQRSGAINAALISKQVEQYCRLNTEQQQFMQKAVSQLNLSARAYHRVLKVARTIADLADSANIQLNHLSEALFYRTFAHKHDNERSIHHEA